MPKTVETVSVKSITLRKGDVLPMSAVSWMMSLQKNHKKRPEPGGGVGSGLNVLERTAAKI